MCNETSMFKISHLFASIVFLMVASASYADANGPAFPTTGAGVKMDLSKDVSADVTYNRIQPVDTNAKLDDTDFVGVGFNFSLD